MFLDATSITIYMHVGHFMHFSFVFKLLESNQYINDIWTKEKENIPLSKSF